jgi:hypothetical protein
MDSPRRCVGKPQAHHQFAGLAGGQSSHHEEDDAGQHSTIHDHLFHDLEGQIDSRSETQPSKNPPISLTYQDGREGWKGELSKVPVRRPAHPSGNDNGCIVLGTRGDNRYLMPDRRATLPKYNAISAAFRTCAILLLTCATAAQERCAAEVKLLLSPAEVSAVVAALKLAKETKGQVYFFDTPALDLLSKGVIVRLRQGANNDLTVKVRPPENKKFADPSAGREDFKCELDLTGDKAVQSYSIRSQYAGSQVPDAGQDISNMLSDGQRKLLKETTISIDWTRVKKVANIRSTVWETKSQRPFDKLTLEFWEWPVGSILELSTRVEADKGPPTLAELRRLANARGLAVSPSQRSKTSMVLETFSGTK